MSPAPLIPTTPEGTKRRKLNPKLSNTYTRSQSQMSPALIQEVDAEPEKAQSLELKPVEATLRRLLLDVARYVDETPAPETADTQVPLPDTLAQEPTILRFTGGWVRDKLLGVESHDIDVAINKMTGYQFGLRLKEYLEIAGNPEKYGLEGVAQNDKQNAKATSSDKSKTVGGLHKIEANPEKSKHLETVTTRILGLDIDLVNLRKETYSDDSRNPQMEFGTPEEDALRRDATVNAMFYNLNTEQIEDFTGKGHDDMRSKIIRTPLEPYQTFKDDPLRVLRLIRFASRLGYTVESNVLTAMSDLEIKDALKRKISRERIGVELEKALRGPDPHEAMRLIFQLELYDTIFSDPTVEHSKQFAPDTDGWRSLIDRLEDLHDSDNVISKTLIRDNDEQHLAWVLASLVPYRDAPQADATEPGRKPPPPISTSVAREGIKATNKVCDVITAAVRNGNEITKLVDGVYERKRRPEKQYQGEDATARDVLGMAIRRWGPTWRSQVLYSLLVEIVENQDSSDACERRYSTFLQHLHDLDILEACSIKPLLDGKALAKALQTPPGPWMKDALDVVTAWQLRHPDSKDTQAAVEEVKKHGELTSALVSHFLKLTIRPLFVKAKPDSVTEQGRKKTSAVLPPKMTGALLDESVTKPWKNAKESQGLELLKWVIRSLDENSLEQVWPLVIPPLLTLIDDWETKYKIMGATLLEQLLKVTPSSLLKRTGLGDVFEEALLPCLTCLPTITPEDESIALLSSVYPALLTLGRVSFPETTVSSAGTTAISDHRAGRIKHTDCVIRKGVIYAYTHSGQHPNIVAVLFDNLIPLLNELGIDSVKHLKYVLPMLTDTMSHPLAPAHPTSFLSSVRAVQAVILNAWPRISEHRGEVLKGLTLGWLRLESVADLQARSKLEEEMRESVKLLRAVVAKLVDFDAECDALIDADPRLEGLLL